MVRYAEPDLPILDVRLAGMKGILWIRAVKNSYKVLKVHALFIRLSRFLVSSLDDIAPGFCETLIFILRTWRHRAVAAVKAEA